LLTFHLDLFKLVIYLAFFFILLTFYGLPIHIMRDLFMTARSFVKRLGAFLRYRKAIQDMNRYADATAEDLEREDTCIICRDEMRPWDPVANPGAIERTRPKKLPCGHILHYGCLKSWIERQQVCPTCRRPVGTDPAPGDQNRDAVLARMVFGAPPAVPAAQQPAENGALVAPQVVPPAPRNGGVRMFNLGPLRLGFAQGDAQNIQELAQRMAAPPVDGGNTPAPPPPAAQHRPEELGSSMPLIRTRIEELDQLIQREVQTVQVVQQEMQIINLLNAELTRIRQLQEQQQQQQQQGLQPPPQGIFPNPETGMFTTHPQPQYAMPSLFPPIPPLPSFALPPRVGTPSLTRHGVGSGTTAIPAGSPELPEGVVIPPGWSLLPLQRLDGNVPQPPAPFRMEHAHRDPNLNPPLPATPPELAIRLDGPAALRPGRTPSPAILPAERAESVITTAFPEEASPSSNPAAPRASQAPNWGGSAQVFGNGSRAIATSGNASDSAPRDQAPSDQPYNSAQILGNGLGGAVPGNAPDSALSDRASPHQPSSSAVESRASNSSAAPATPTPAPATEGMQENGSSDKGKGKAATVEEAEDDDNEQV
jgi:E3 ubiquitin-protein ligase synoviolin